MGLYEQTSGDRRIHTPTYNAMVRLTRALGNLKFNGADFMVRDGFVSLAAGPAAGFPWSLLSFGYEILGPADSNKVRIFAGSVVLHGETRSQVDCVQTDVEVANDDIVYVAYDWSSTPETATVAAAATVPENSADKAYFALYKFAKVTGPPVVVTLLAIYRLGNIEIIPRQSA